MLAGHRGFLWIRLASACTSLQAQQASCYGARLKPFVSRTSPEFLSTRNRGPRLGKFSNYSFGVLSALLLNVPIANGHTTTHQIKATPPAEDKTRFESIPEVSPPPMRLL